MPLAPFKSSPALTLGVELELQLISLSDFNLTSSAYDVLEFLKRKPFPGTVVPEMTESMIEVATGIHSHYDTLHAQLREIRDVLVRAGDTLNIGFCGGGTHPFQKWTDQSIYPKERFKNLSALYGYLAKQFTIFGQHVHVGCTSGNDALYLLHALNRYIPHFIALSGSSPFVQGGDTLFHSARLNSVFAFPLSGRAPFILNWPEFEDVYFTKMQHTGVVKSMKDFYWDIRPKPEYGTIELRVCDTPLSVTTAASLACYLQALCQYLLDKNEPAPAEDDYLVYNYNRFQACRFGLEGVIVHPKNYAQLSLREDILTTLQQIGPYANALGCADALDNIYRITREGNDANYLRQRFVDQGSVEGMVDAAITTFREEK